MTEKEFRETYPPEVIELMLQRQEEQGNPKSIEPFLKDLDRSRDKGGFNWSKTPEGFSFWHYTLYFNTNVLF